MKTLILTPNRRLNCGMYQLAKDLAKEFDGEVKTKKDKLLYEDLYNNEYKQVITLMYPMHKHGKHLKENYGIKWICYDQKIPSITKTYFPNFWRRQVMRYINWRNNVTMQGADEYWDVTEREQKPRWTEKTTKEIFNFPVGTYNKHFAQYRLTEEKWEYALYVGRKTDYKNFEWLWKTMDELKIPFIIPPENCSDEEIHTYYSHAKMFVTASIWEGYGRPVMEAESLGIPAVSFDTDAHKRNTKLGICVENHNFNALKESIKIVCERETK